MKRSLSILSVIALLFSLFGFASVVNATTIPGVRIKNVVEKEDQWEVTANLVGLAAKAVTNGQWKIFVNGETDAKKTEEFKSRDIKFALPKTNLSNGVSSVKVELTAVINGKQVTLSDEQTVVDVNIKNIAEAGDKWKVDAELAGVDANAGINGTWKIFVNGDQNPYKEVSKQPKDSKITFELPKADFSTGVAKVKVEFVGKNALPVQVNAEQTLADVSIKNVAEKVRKWEVKADLVGVEGNLPVEGQWKIFVNDDPKPFQINPSAGTFDLPKAKFPNGVSKVKVEFAGKIGTLPVQVYDEQPVVDVSIKKAEPVGDNWVVEAELNGVADNAVINGNWKIFVNEALKPEMIKPYTNFKIAFNLPKADFPVIAKVKVVFDGKINDQPVQRFDERLILNGGAPGGGETAENRNIHLRFDFDDDLNPFVEAELVGDAQNVQGNWTIYVDGKEYDKLENNNQKKITVELPKEFNKVKVVFEGTVDGKKTKGEKEFDFTGIDVEITHKEVNGKDQFTANIKGVQKAEGKWFLAYGDDEKMIDFAQGQGGATFTHAFENVKPGKYIIVAIFEGTINGDSYAVLGNAVGFEKEENGDVVVNPPADDKQPPFLDPEETHKQIDEAKKGGKLPKTATTYPVGVVAGLVFLAIGVIGFAVLKLRRGRA